MTGQRGSRAKDVQCRPMGGRDRMPLCMFCSGQKERKRVMHSGRWPAVFYNLVQVAAAAACKRGF